MLESWFWLDPGSYRFELGHYRQESHVSLPALVTKKGQVVGQQAAQLRQQEVVKSPLDHGRLTAPVTNLIQEGLLQAGYQNAFLRPAFVLALPTDLDENMEQAWHQACLNAGASKVRVVKNKDLLSFEKSHFVILAGHSYTELLVYSQGRCVMNKTIYFAGQQMDEAIGLKVLKHHKLMIQQPELKQAWSQAKMKQVRPELIATGLTNRGHWQSQLISPDFVAAGILTVMEQIIEWTKVLMSRLDLTTRALIHENGIILAGGLANLYGFDLALQQAFGDKVICIPELVSERLKGWRS